MVYALIFFSSCQTKEDKTLQFAQFQDEVRRPSPCKTCNDEISARSAHVYLFKRDSLCNIHKLLNSPYPRVPRYENTIPNGCTSTNFNDTVLVGYYIQPILRIDAPVNQLKFTPVWLVQEDNITKQYYGDSIVIGPNRYAMTQNSTSVYLESRNANLRLDHKKFQFHELIKRESNGNYQFDKVYISWYELKMILSYCQFLGISGTRTSSGNITPRDWTMNNSAVMNQVVNKDYFTYRFAGYIPIRSGSNQFVLANNKNANNQFDSSVPTIAIGNPCPPMWR